VSFNPGGRNAFYRWQQDFTLGEFYPPTLTLPLGGGRCEKIGICPLTLPSPARGEGKHIEIRKKFPPPWGGRGRVGVIYEIISHLQGGKGEGDVFRDFYATFRLTFIVTHNWFPSALPRNFICNSDLRPQTSDVRFLLTAMPFSLCDLWPLAPLSLMSGV